MVHRRSTNFPEILDTSENCVLQEGYMKQVLYWGLTNIRWYCMQFSHLVGLASIICAVLWFIHMHINMRVLLLVSYWPLTKDVHTWFYTSTYGIFSGWTQWHKDRFFSWVPQNMLISIIASVLRIHLYAIDANLSSWQHH